MKAFFKKIHLNSFNSNILVVIGEDREVIKKLKNNVKDIPIDFWENNLFKECWVAGHQEIWKDDILMYNFIH